MRRSTDRLPVHKTAADHKISNGRDPDATMPTPERPLSPPPPNGTEPLGAATSPAGSSFHELIPNGTPHEVMRPNLPIETFRLHTSHHGPCSCPFCDAPMQEITRTRERWSKQLIVRAENVSAYRCETDAYEKTDITAQIAFLSGALAHIERTDDREAAAALRQELAAAQAIEKLQSAASAA